jgi:putative endonuclease
MKDPDVFYLYMMTNRSRVVLYTGVTNDLERRVWEHVNQVLKGFTSRYRVDRLVYYEDCRDVRDAIAREKEVKAWRREKKNALVESINPRWRNLAVELFGDLRDPSLRSG